MLALSQMLFFAAFAGYLSASVLYIGRLTGKAETAATAGRGADRSGSLARAALGVTQASVIVHGCAMALRWVASGQAPMSNLYEFMSLFGWSAMLFFILINRRYGLPALGAFAAPVGLFVIAYGSLFSAKVQPLVPVLQSYWLVLHVSFAALGEGAFAVSFAAAIMYLLRTRKEQSYSLLEERGLEFIFASGAVLFGFIIVALGFKFFGYAVEVPQTGGLRPLAYSIPPFVGPTGIRPGSVTEFLGLPLPLFSAPAWMEGVAAGRKLNTLMVSLVSGFVIYWGVRLYTGQPWREVLSRPIQDLPPDVLDDISYRGIAIGFPLFTLGAMVFAMIWAQKAWGSYWSWDPKETWSLISWLFYTGYLHLRIMRGWEGRPAAWIAATGFVIIIFTLVGVNLLISGLHSYAGG